MVEGPVVSNRAQRRRGDFETLNSLLERGGGGSLFATRKHQGVMKIETACLICKGETGRKKMVRDHDHRTGFIRGPLCELCNAWLGLYENGLKMGKRVRHWRRRFKIEIAEHLTRDTGVKYVRFPDSKLSRPANMIPVGTPKEINPWGIVITRLPPGDARGSHAWMGRKC